jgi:hypothetical protein
VSFTTVEKAKIKLRIPESTDKFDDDLTAIVEAVNCELLDWLCLISCDPTSYILQAGLDSSQVIRNLRLNPRPIVSIDSVVLYGTTLAAEEYRLIAPDVLRFCEPERCCSYGRHAMSRRSDIGCRDAVVTVTAGFDPADPLLKVICYYATVMVVQEFRSNGEDDLKIKQIRSYRRERFKPSDIGGNFPPGWPQGLTRALGKFLRVMHMTTATVEP